MSQIPAAILDALNTVGNDAATVASDTAAVTTAQAAADAADAVVPPLTATLASDQQTLAQDLVTAEALIQQTYGTATPPASVIAAVNHAKVKLEASKQLVAASKRKR